MVHPFDGIQEKLRRVDENVVNLKAELETFIQSGKYPVIPHQDDEHWQEAVDYHRRKVIPNRFSVLAGEIVHHLRSSLDHIVWHFSNETTRRESPNAIEFPVFQFRPTLKSDISRYERKIQGVLDPKVRELIGNLQPYHAGADAADQLLCIIHDMDRFDKHRELAIVISTALITFPNLPDAFELASKLAMYKEGKLPAAERPAISRAIKDYGHVTPQVSFRNFGRREIQPILPGLAQLADHVRDVVARFTVLLG
jgi:hypothetical protein